ncbi:MAG: DNA polymerase/3'-5' exonuclease PolX [Thermodesulfobacteria bacterium]|nr:DNA polymerase/3'-5' exonuclease PolX [Thermodesulfobacteriota bacterium]
MVNQQIAQKFYKTADLLEIMGENPFRVRAYRNAARTIESLGRDLSEMVAQGEDLTKLPGIGKDLAQKIQEIIETGTFQKLKELEEEVPPGLIELLKVEGLGPKRIKTLYDTLGITSLEELREAAQKGEISKLPGFGKKLEQTILKGVVLAKKEGRRFRWAYVESFALELVDFLKKAKGLNAIEVAGSFRRKKETVGDLDILVTATNPKEVIEHFVTFPEIKEVLSKGSTRSTIILSSNIQVDLRAVEEESYGSALHYFTGSKAHNIAIRSLAQKLGLKINEYGVFKGEERIAGRSEEEIFASVGLPYIEPELRENRGEIEAAMEGRLPKLITISDIRGDLHCHTKWSDGQYSIAEMVAAARRLGHSYIAITDHSRRLAMIKGLDEKRLEMQAREIEEVRGHFPDIQILHGIEVDILEDGSLDLPDSALELLDIVVAAIHSKFKLSKKKQTMRLLKAMDNPHVNIIAHPTGRLIGVREGYELDMEKVMKHAAQNGCILELNAQPSRLDLNDVNLKLAKEMGIKISIATDAHNMDNLLYMRYGVNQARRGWLERRDVINTLSAEKLLETLKRQ